MSVRSCGDRCSSLAGQGIRPLSCRKCRTEPSRHHDRPDLWKRRIKPTIVLAPRIHAQEQPHIRHVFFGLRELRVALDPVSDAVPNRIAASPQLVESEPVGLGFRFRTVRDPPVYAPILVHVWRCMALRNVHRDDRCARGQPYLVAGTSQSLRQEVWARVEVFSRALPQTLQRRVHFRVRNTREETGNGVVPIFLTDAQEEPTPIRVRERRQRLRECARRHRPALVLHIPSLAHTLESNKVGRIQVSNRCIERRIRSHAVPLFLGLSEPIRVYRRPASVSLVATGVENWVGVVVSVGTASRSSNRRWRFSPPSGCAEISLVSQQLFEQNQLVRVFEIR